MKKIIMCFLLSISLFMVACTNSTKADSKIKLDTSKIEVNATTIDEVEDLASQDVSNTIQSLNDQRDAIAAKITDYNSYQENVSEIKTYYTKVIHESTSLGIRLREYAYKYAEIIMKNEDSYSDKYKDLGGIYSAIYDDAGKDMYDIYDDTLKDMYDTYYNGILKDAYDNDDLAYDQWYDVRSDAYDDWYDSRSDVYDIWSDTRSDVYDFSSDLRSEVYDKDKDRADKIMNKFKKKILRLKEDVNDE